MTLTYRERERLRKQQWRRENPDKARKQNRNGKARKARPFVAVDGEGYDDENGRHLYNMLRVGDDLLEPGNGRVLTTWECLDFLCSRNPDNIYVAYYFDYDVTKILENISWYKLGRLVDRDSRRSNYGDTFPVDLQDGTYQIDYMRGKYFKCRKYIRSEIGEAGKEKRIYTKWIVINDVGPFFQCRFPDALAAWNVGTAKQISDIRDGKDQRNYHSIEDVARIKEYNHLECVLLAELMEQFRQACIDVGYIPRKWQGPGQIAEVMLDVNGIPRSKDVDLLRNPANKRLLEFGRNAFYGGRPETTGVGRFVGPVYQWDINSAYPYALLHVPCLVHGTFRHDRKSERTGSLCIEPLSLCYGSFKKKDEPGRPILYGLPFRTESGVIMYPESGRGWYWGFEILASEHQSFAAEETYTYIRNCDCQPFHWIRDVYAMRRGMGKDGRGIVLKLALNSLYGKMAQSIGSPKFANPIWASFITAFCRTQVQSLIHQHDKEKRCGEGVAMIATDAIFTCHELDVDDNKELGGCSKEVHPNGIFIVQPGLYFRSSLDADGNVHTPKTRGVPKSKVIEYRDQFERNYQRMRESRDVAEGDVEIRLRSFVGIRQAIHRNNRTVLGQWVPTTKRISFDWSNKRDLHFTNSSPFIQHIGTYPYREPPQEETTPYNKDIGALFAEERIEQEDQPDWADTFDVLEAMGDKQ